MWDSDFLALMFRVEDCYVRAVAGHPWNGVDSVCTDSCVEFFVSPVKGSDAYLNCEVNPGGTMLIEAHDGLISGGIGDDKPTIHEVIPMSTTMPPNIESVMTAFLVHTQFGCTEHFYKQAQELVCDATCLFWWNVISGTNQDPLRRNGTNSAFLVAMMCYSPEIEGPVTWCVEYHLPNSLFVKYFGAEAALGTQSCSRSALVVGIVLTCSPANWTATQP
jgi:hypothetical protein|eukprot:COSAG02_NODE_110_length_36062_cov_85.812106_27_plen_219_part_00